jgi:hypothetical protein
VTFADPIKAKTWAAGAKSIFASLTHKPPRSTESHPSKLFSAKPITHGTQFHTSQNLMVKPSQVEKYSGVERNLSLPIVKQSDSITVVMSPTPTPPNLNLIRFEVEYNCPPGWVPHQPTAWPSTANLGATVPPPPSRGNFSSNPKDNKQPTSGLSKGALHHSPIASRQTNKTLRRTDNLTRNDTNMCAVTENIEHIESSSTKSDSAIKKM